MERKLYFTYNEIHATVKAVADKIQASGFTPDLTVAIGTGGFIPARILKTYLKKPILTVGLAYYDENDRPTAQPQKIQWIDEVERKLTGKKVLLIDEIDDTRATLSYCLKELLTHKPAEIAVAVLHNKIKPKKAEYPSEVTKIWAGVDIPDQWVVYPWDATDIEAHDNAWKEENLYS